MEFSELVKRFAAAAASGNGDALADLFTADGTYDDYFFGPSTGREAIKAMLAHFAEGGRNFRWEFFDPVAAGNIGYASYGSVSIPRGPRPRARAWCSTASAASISRAAASAAIRRCSTAAWRWRSRTSSPSGCARSASSMPAP